MAEIAVINLLVEFTPLLLDELQTLAGVRVELDAIKDDLESMRALLMDADRRQDSEQGVKIWVRQVRELAYDIEDVLDKFRRSKVRPCGPEYDGFFPYILHHAKKLIARRRTSDKVRSIKLRLEAISRRRGDFIFAPMVVDTHPRGTHELQMNAALFAEESQLVGIRRRKDQLVESLLQYEEKRVVLSVVGMGGLGKTTLVRKVYEDRRLEVRFDSFAWISVSESLGIVDLFRAMVKDFFKVRRHHVPKEISEMSAEQLVKKLRHYLSKKSYLAVLDDVWSIEEWEQLKCALPENNKGSRIIVTTRIADVADYCSGAPRYVHTLQPLPNREAWTLFCNKTFGSDMNNGTCPPELERTSQAILRICGGLPLAIVTIGGLLSTKRRTLAEWDTVRRSLESELEHGDKLHSLRRILGLSYDDLPYHVKPCFLYFGVFPEDHFISRSKLIRLWIAEGFVSPYPGMSLEEISEAKLDELVRRNLVQVVSLDSYGRVERCQVHDLMRWLILAKSREHNFVTLPQDKEKSAQYDRVRRLSVHPGQHFPNKKKLPHLRSLFIFGQKETIRFSTFKMVKVLNLTGVQFSEIPSELFDLFFLRYLNLRRTKIQVIPESIRKLQNLQTMDIKYTDVKELPAGILNLNHLRHLLAFCHQDGVGVKMPAKVSSLTSLQKLYCLELGASDQVRELGRLTQLRTLSISGVSRYHIEGHLSASISNLCRLQSLVVSTKHETRPEEMQRFLTSPFLRCFKFYGRIKRLPHMLGSLANLVKIKLGGCALNDDPFKTLQHAPGLLDLRLRDAYKGESIATNTGGFPKLKILIISEFSDLRQIIIEEGALPSLVCLTIRDCAHLAHVPNGIEHLTSLNELDLINASDNFMERIRREGGADWDRVKHIPLIRNWHGDDGDWHRENIETPVTPRIRAYASSTSDEDYVHYGFPQTPHWRIFESSRSTSTPTRSHKFK